MQGFFGFLSVLFLPLHSSSGHFCGFGLPAAGMAFAGITKDTRAVHFTRQEQSGQR